MSEPKDNVVKFVARSSGGNVVKLTGKLPANHEPLRHERMRIVRMLKESGEDVPAPVSHVYKALAFMAEDSQLPSDLRLEYPIGNGLGEVVMLTSFTAHPGEIRTTTQVRAPDVFNRHEDIKPTLGRAALDDVFKILGPEFTVYQVYALRPARSYIGALLGLGLILEDIKVDSSKHYIFNFAYKAPEGIYPVIVTLYMPHVD